MERRIDRTIFLIHNRTLFRQLFYKIFYSKTTDYKKQESAKRRLYLNYRCNPDNPNSFNEYLQWIKHNYRNDLWKLCADKIECKNFLISCGLNEFVPKTLAVYNNSLEIDLDNLPEKFVLKSNNDSGSVYICDKQHTDFPSVFKKLDQSLKTNYSNIKSEWFYDGIKPRIIAEELLEPAGTKDLCDYKLFVFNGKYKFGFIASNRSSNLRFTLFEGDFCFVPCEYGHRRPKKVDLPSRPDNFSQMIQIAEKVGSYFDFVRVDLYNTAKGIKIGELTFTSMSGFGAFTKKKYDFKYGEYFKDTIFYELAHKKDK